MSPNPVEGEPLVSRLFVLGGARSGKSSFAEAWIQARSQARLRPFHLVGPAFEAFVLEQVASFEGLARELGLLNPSISDRSTP